VNDGPGNGAGGWVGRWAGGSGASKQSRFAGGVCVVGEGWCFGGCQALLGHSDPRWVSQVAGRIRSAPTRMLWAGSRCTQRGPARRPLSEHAAESSPPRTSRGEKNSLHIKAFRHFHGPSFSLFLLLQTHTTAYRTQQNIDKWPRGCLQPDRNATVVVRSVSRPTIEPSRKTIITRALSSVLPMMR
jgi:hypothetical protein